MAGSRPAMTADTCSNQTVYLVTRGSLRAKSFGLLEISVATNVSLVRPAMAKPHIANAKLFFKTRQVSDCRLIRAG